MRQPTLEGAKGVIATPFSASHGTQAASDPRRGQLAPPVARITLRATIRRVPSGVSKANPPPANPVQRQRRRSATPSPSSRASQALRSGEAFIPTGNTRPVEPVNNSTPSPRANSITSTGPNASIIGASCGAS